MQSNENEKIDKIKNLYNHPSTHPNIKANAYKMLRGYGLSDEQISPKQHVPPPTSRPSPVNVRQTVLNEASKICNYLDRLGYHSSNFSLSFITYRCGRYRIVVDDCTGRWSIFESSLDFMVGSGAKYAGSGFNTFKSTFDRI